MCRVTLSRCLQAHSRGVASAEAGTLLRVEVEELEIPLAPTLGGSERGEIRHAVLPGAEPQGGERGGREVVQAGRGGREVCSLCFRQRAVDQAVFVKLVRSSQRVEGAHAHASLVWRRCPYRVVVPSQ